MQKLVTWTILTLALLAGWDFYQRREKRAILGPGYELRHGQLIKVRLIQDFLVNSAMVDSDIKFRVFPETSLGSTAIGDGILTDALLVARVVKQGHSQTLAHQSVIFEFREVRLPGGQRVNFKGSIYSPDDPAHMGEAPIIGSFVGMEYGPIGIVGGFLLGTVLPHYYGQRYAAPQCYAVRDVKVSEDILIKVHYADYIPFKLRPTTTAQTNKEF